MVEESDGVIGFAIRAIHKYPPLLKKKLNST